MTSCEPRLPNIELAARRLEAQTWMRDATFVDQLAGVPESAQSLSFLQKHVSLGVIYNTHLATESLEEDNVQLPDIPVLLTPVFPSDATRLLPSQNSFIEQIRSIASKDQYFLGGYTRKIRVITRPQDGINSRYPEPMSSVAQGLSILHEGHHARIDVEEQTQLKVVADVWREEVVVREKELAIISAIGGTGYEALVQECADGTISDPVTGEITPGIANAAISNELWTDLIGGNITSSELRMWLDTAALYGVWQFCMRNRSDPREEFAKFLAIRDNQLQADLSNGV